MNAVKARHLWAFVPHGVRSHRRVGRDRHCNGMAMCNCWNANADDMPVHRRGAFGQVSCPGIGCEVCAADEVSAVGVETVSVTIDPPRPLTPAESLTLTALLSQGFVGAAKFRQQAAAAMVNGRCDCGCPSVDLLVPTGLQSAPFESRLVPAGAQVVPAGDEPPGQVILLADDGFLSYLECVWISDNPPHDWPNENRLRLTVA